MHQFKYIHYVRWLLGPMETVEIHSLRLLLGPVETIKIHSLRTLLGPMEITEIHSLRTLLGPVEIILQNQESLLNKLQDHKEADLPETLKFVLVTFHSQANNAERIQA